MQRVVRPSIVEGVVRAPSSKSYTHRALVVGHLSGRPYRVERPLVADDTKATRNGLVALGSRVTTRPGVWRIAPGGARGPRVPTVRCGESGTTLRLLLAAAARLDRRVRFDGRPQLRRRPIEGLVGPLVAHGATLGSHGGSALPLDVRGPIQGGSYRVDGSVSSQYVSALLLVLPTLAEPSTLRVDGALVSAPYVAATEAVLSAHRIRFARRGSTWRIPGGQRYVGRRFEVPGDASSAAYLWTAAALTRGRVRVDGVDPRWPQADRRVLSVLRSAGATVRERGGSTTVEGPLARGFDVDLTDSPDLFPLLGVLAAAIPDRSTLRGAPHLAFKESDRREGTTRLAKALGATVTSRAGGLVIRGVPAMRRVRLSGLDDHRLVMSAAVGALAARGPSSIGDAGAVAKSFPDFWSVLRTLGARTEVAA